MDIIDSHREMVEKMDLLPDKRNKIQENLDQMGEELKKVKIYQEEWEKVEQHNQKIEDQIQAILKEGGDSSKLSMELMIPSMEAVLGIEAGQAKIRRLVKENMDIVKSNMAPDDTNSSMGLSNNTIFLTIINILIWGIVLYLLFFGPKLGQN